MSSVQDVRPQKVPIMLDKQRHLYFDLNAFAELEEEYGSVESAMKAMETGSIKAIRLLVWAGLIHEELDEDSNAKITPKQVGAMLTLENMKELSEKLGRAIRQAVPQEAIEESEKQLNKVASPLANPSPPQKT